ncbi:MAG TPA: HVO_0476 family zinc finger protein [Candidatus Methanofastidiosa archaeon]|nr:HVO_0476 family zinc finger protein [Candidatus Methanofastidiosa archaeon]HPR41036.1 HVO_0476 family zinc finger protein [Candidatus Methanofastidiosa archaeon]
MECEHEEYDILKERGRQVTAKCLNCGEIFTFTKEKSIMVPIVINRRENSEKSCLRMKRDRTVKVGDLLDVEGEVVEVHAIEVGNRRVDSEAVDLITSLWGVSLTYPKVIGVSVHLPKGTLSYKVKVDRDGLFRIGDVCQIGDMVFELTAMITDSGKRKSAYGDEIKRIYGIPSRKLANLLLEVYNGV